MGNFFTSSKEKDALIASMQVTIDTLKAELNAAKDTIEALNSNAELEQANASLEQADKQIVELTDKVTSMQSELDTFDARVKEASAKKVAELGFAPVAKTEPEPIEQGFKTMNEALQALAKKSKP